MPRIHGHHHQVGHHHHHRPHCRPVGPVVVVSPRPPCRPVAPVVVVSPRPPCRPVWHRPTTWFHRPAAPIIATHSIRPIVATGVAATVAGIALMILGACLTPVSFGASIGLIIAGGIITAGGVSALIYSRRC